MGNCNTIDCCDKETKETIVSTQSMRTKSEPAVEKVKRGRPATLTQDRRAFFAEYIKDHPLVGHSVAKYYNDNEEIHRYFNNVTTFMNFMSKNKDQFKLVHEKPFSDYEFTGPIKNLSMYYRNHQLWDIGTYQQFRNEYTRRFPKDTE